MFIDGEMWQEQRRFALRHLRDLGFGRTSSENIIHEEIHDLIEKIKSQAKSNNGVVDFKGIFPLSMLNVLWSIIGGERFQHDDARLKKLLEAVNLFVRSGNQFRAGIPVPKFLLKIFPFLKRFLGIPVELFVPIQNFIRVFYIFSFHSLFYHFENNFSYRRRSKNMKKNGRKMLRATLWTFTWLKWKK